MSSGTVIMNRNDWIFITFGQRTDDVCSPFLHLCISPLHCVQFDGIAVLTGFDRRNSTSAHSDPVIVAANYHHLFVWFGCSFQRIAFVGIAYTACKHDYFVISVGFVVFLVFERKQRTANKWLSEFITEVGGAV